MEHAKMLQTSVRRK